MKIRFLKAAIFLAVAGAALAGPRARATVVSGTTGDIILSFYSTGAESSQGANTDLEIDLGAASTFTSPASSEFSLLELAVADLNSTFGSDWYQRTDLYWGIIGTTAGESPTLYASNPETTAGTQSTAWTREPANVQRTPESQILGLYTGPVAEGALIGATSTANSSESALIDNSLADSYTVLDTAQAGESFKYFNPTIDGSVDNFSATGSILDGTDYNVLDLYKLAPGSGSGTLVGGIGLNASGNLVFDSNISQFGPAPEPSAVAMAGAGAASLFALRGMRRRKRASA